MYVFKLTSSFLWFVCTHSHYFDVEDLVPRWTLVLITDKKTRLLPGLNTRSLLLALHCLTVLGLIDCRLLIVTETLVVHEFGKLCLPRILLVHHL